MPAASAARAESDLPTSGFSAYVQRCGAMGVKVIELKKLSKVIGEAIKPPDPALVEMITNPELV
ncbi:hypothetical protein [Neptunomonas sp.]|uniref:hypothetical protein n=1 Tax=Neptunomonas sp. TaxID=1971898 RepID=UPI003563AC3C